MAGPGGEKGNARYNLGTRNEPERLLRHSLELLEDLGDRDGQAQVLHSLAKLIASKDPDEAERLLRRSLELGEDLGHRFHQGQVCNSLAHFTKGLGRSDDAEYWFNEALKRSRHPRTRAIACEGLSRLMEWKDLPQAISYQEQAIGYQENAGHRWFLPAMRRRLQRLKSRLPNF